MSSKLYIYKIFVNVMWRRKKTCNAKLTASVMCRTLCIVHFTVITFTDTHYQSQVSKQVCAQKT